MNIVTLSATFFEGLLSFLSPCILPLIPLYISYLSDDNEDNNKKVFLKTIFFVLGIITTFFIFGLSISFIQEYILKYQEIISIIGGTILIIFSLHELGILDIHILNKELSFKNKIDTKDMSFAKAYLFGFIFSFAWTPCIGPMLASTLLMAATSINGFLYLIAYALGLIIPFIITGLFTKQVLSFINDSSFLHKYILKISGIIILLFGLYMLYNSSKTIINLKNNIGSNQTIINDNSENVDDNKQDENNDQEEKTLMEMIFYDHKGNEIKLEDYNDKHIFLNFITSWCTYCKQEMPYFMEFSNNEEVVCIYVMSPLASNEMSKEKLKNYINEQNISLPVIIDDTGYLLYGFGISAYPTLAVIDNEGTIYNPLPGMMDIEGFNNILNYLKDKDN